MAPVLPGDILTVQTTSTGLKLGPGLRQDLDNVTATKAGIMSQNASSDRIWLQSSQRRVTKSVESYRVDIASAHSASLGNLAFENATKRNKPNLEDMEPELECFNPSNGKADGFGELKADYVIFFPSFSFLLDVLKALSFELAVGMNGRDMGNADTTTHTDFTRKNVKEYVKSIAKLLIM
ncbi:hypothetical protein BC829DRAFT_425196 [Chytridium lagenaria]|nr:hypothetical protein BC829DRAFT_425196 [Chytridium lagenaria]